MCSPSGIRGAGTAHEPHRHACDSFERRADTPTIPHSTLPLPRLRPPRSTELAPVVRRHHEPRANLRQAWPMTDPPKAAAADPAAAAAVTRGMRSQLARRDAALAAGATP